MSGANKIVRVLACLARCRNPHARFAGSSSAREVEKDSGEDGIEDGGGRQVVERGSTMAHADMRLRTPAANGVVTTARAGSKAAAFMEALPATVARRAAQSTRLAVRVRGR